MENNTGQGEHPDCEVVPALRAGLLREPSRRLQARASYSVGCPNALRFANWFPSVAALGSRFWRVCHG